MNIKLYHGDCLEVMDELIAKGVVVDAIITDPPYGITACSWDSPIPFNNFIMQPKSKRSKKMEPIYRDEYILQELKKGRDYKGICEYFDKNSKEGMWQKLNKLIKPNGAIVLFGSEPFSSALRMSNIKYYKYDWVWEKNMVTGLMLAKRQPLRKYEIISIFYEKQPTYNRQMTKRTEKEFKECYRFNDSVDTKSEHYISKKIRQSKERQWYKPPVNIIKFDIDRKRNGNQHPTQKPVALLEYLIKTYTNEGETVLDNCMGSGSTGVACVNTGRNFIGIEKEEKYFNIAKKRIEEAEQNKKEELFK
jgi:site-specific DNA-methyltransferase (adenine-specific)